MILYSAHNCEVSLSRSFFRNRHYTESFAQLLTFNIILLSRFILQHGGRALLADEMGLGKTIQASISSIILIIS